ncbi:MAG: hypothetical protein IKW96_06335 [Ruminococcus sp.]|uniref:hypothetical protein n=1 Tax=Ruminococcus sp. TaxID=41978 RepID=UPI0025D44714|nr:hypothetical protein [Ruminococcus sp.]MBR5682880.1 hypothetical protein [Ruminococcus sp.]
MVKKLGFSTRAEYDKYKQNCQLNFKNKFCISDEWVINEYSLRIYPSKDIRNISQVNTGYGASGVKSGCFLMIGYVGGSDKFCVNSREDMEYLLKAVNEYIRCRNNGTVFIQEKL